MYGFFVNNSQEEAAGNESIHGGWMTLLLISGFIIAAIPFFMGGLVGVLGTDALGIWRSILTNFGTTLIMAGLLLVVEPKVRRAVNKAVSRTVETAAVAATAAATSSIREDLLKDVQDDIEERFDSLTDRIESILQDGLATQDRKIAGFADDYSYESARSAVQAAVEYNSLHNNEIIVQATDIPGELSLGLTLAVPEALQHDRYFGREETDPNDLILKLVGYTAGAQGHSEVEWENTDDFGSAIGKLVGALERRGIWGRAKFVDWEAVHRRLVDGLAVAAKSTRKEPTSLHLLGRLTEIVGTDTLWYLTDQSIECPNHDFVLPRRNFPQIQFPSSTGNSPLEPVAEKPEWADQQTWDYVIQRGRREFTGSFF